MAKSLRSMRKAALRSSSSSYSKVREMSRWVYYASDLLSLEGKDLRKEPLTTRRRLLADLLKKPPDHIRLSDELRGTKDELLRVAQEFGLEGSVAKRKSSVYESGRGAVAPGSNSRSPRVKSSLSAVIRCLKEDAILRLAARWLSKPGWPRVRRQSRDWL